MEDAVAILLLYFLGDLTSCWWWWVGDVVWFRFNRSMFIFDRQRTVSLARLSGSTTSEKLLAWPGINTPGVPNRLCPLC